MQTNAAPASASEVAGSDLGPLAWVLDELKKSLDGATKAMRRFVRDADLARGSDLAELDASQLRIARQQLHQAVGALEMVGLGAPAKVMRAMEALAQKFVQRPELCSDDAATKVERAAFALAEYLEGVLKGKTASPVALFAQYRDVLELVGGDRVHPADLWPIDWSWIEADVAIKGAPLTYGAQVRAQLDQSVLNLVKTGSTVAASNLAELSLRLAAGQESLEARVFWKICAAFFEATALGLCPSDVYSKRAATRVLMQYATLAKLDPAVSDRLAQDLLFFCAQAAPDKGSSAPALVAVRHAYGLTRTKPFDYETPQFGRFDPAVLVQARKRIATATETWSALAGGDTNRLKVVSDQFGMVGESILKLHPECGDLARALVRAVDATVKSGEPPSTPIAMEVATAVLYLEAAYEDLDPTESQMAERSVRLAQRLEHVSAKGQPEPLEGWMEDLYRRVSDRQTMGSVVDELRTALGEIEKSLDQFFRNPKDKVPLHEVPSQLAQMRGVFSVLGLDQASLATLRMRDTVEKFLIDPHADGNTDGFEKLGSSIGALGFLIDMLSYQRAMAKKLFVYDEAAGEFKPVMGREKVAVEAPNVVAKAPLDEAPIEVPVDTQVVPALLPGDHADMAVEAPVSAEDALQPADLVPTTQAALEPLTEPVSAPLEVPQAVAASVPLPPPPPPAELDDDEAEIRDIFLEEAREVVQNAQAAVQALVEAPGDLGHQTTLRRAFHTLKGSSRMVGLTEFGEAGWAMEQLLNAWLAEQKPASQDLIDLSGKAIAGLEAWVQDIAERTDSHWSAQPFRQAADALRLRGERLALVYPGSPAEAEALVEEPVVLAAEPVEDFVAEPLVEVSPEPEPVTAAVEVAEPDLADFDFDIVADVEPAAASVPLAVELVESPSLEAEEESQPDFAPTGLYQPEPGIQPESPVVVEEPIDLGDFDFAEGVAQEPAEPDFAATSFVRSNEFGELPGPPEEEQVAKASLVEEAQPPMDAAEEPVKVIGSLRIGIPLYNVFLNEADEWSRHLLTELSEWSLELDRPVADSTIALAHSLSGSSATVGFMALSEIARALEQSLEHVQLHAKGNAAFAQVFTDAAEDIRRLLHQFAAGFLKEPKPEILQALQTIQETEFEPVEVLQAPELLQVDAAVEPVLVAAAASVLPAATLNLTSAPALMDDRDDDIDLVDALDADLFPIFEEEALELMPQLGGALRQWSARPDNLGARGEVLRVLHTLKGSARLAGAMRMGEMSHRMESAIEQLGTESVDSAQIEPLLTRFDAIGSTFEDLRAGPEQARVVPEAPAAIAVPAADSVKPAEGASPAPAAATKKVTLPSTATAAAVAPLRQIANQSVRVRSQLLDRLVNQAGEVMISRSRLESRVGQLRSSLVDLTGNLEKLRAQLRDIELQSESQMQSRLTLAKDTAQTFDPLEFDRFTRVQELTRMMAESVNDVATVQRNLQRTVEGTEDDLIAQGRQARELQRDLLRTRMVEFEGISERLYGVVRQAAKEAGKQVKLDITGGSMDIDRGVLERMAPAFEHLLRNSVAHGIELPAERASAKKPAVGTISIDLQQQSNEVSVEFNDDGAGLDLPRIRAKAVSSGAAPDAQSLSDADAANLIFLPGLSTAASVNELSGRGIGMDVVRSEVNALGGRIETSTIVGKGTSFKLVLPLTTAVTQVVMMRLGELVIGVPANVIEVVKRVPAGELEAAYKNDAFTHDGEAIPFFWAGALLQASSHSSEAVAKNLPVAIFRSASQRVAVHVDEVLGNQEVVVKNLGPQLARLPGLTGMSVLASGAVVLIYNPVALAAVYGDRAKALRLTAHVANAGAADGGAPLATDFMPSMMAGATQVPLVMVVDDSITVRRVTQRLLKREGYRVVLAADGLQALERLAEEKPAVVLSDIEMPRMDGFDLARNIRADANLRDLPIVMITSRIAEKHREHARELGVDHYLGKPYSEDELLGLVRHYCASRVET